ncbi:MAG: ferredoxin reductase family protein [Candidatus Komeilibacteria bacterium]|nr:ferredoxin reductase family protein [Candidatus Komeilibacteria bacterium]
MPLLIILILVFLPLARWLMISPLSLRFFDLSSAMTSLGQLAGLAGFVLFALNLIISCRCKFLDNLFYGLDRLYQAHRRLGAIAFCLLLFHPIFLAVKYVTFSLAAAAGFFLPQFDSAQNIAISLGIFSLLLMTAVLVITFYLAWKYQNWKISHKFIVAAFALAYLHIIFINSDISRDLWLRFYVIGFGGVGFAAGIYQAFLSRFFYRHLYKVLAVAPLNTQIVEIELEPMGRPLNFQAGQFIFIHFKDRVSAGRDSGVNRAEIHPFTISSAPSEKNLKLVIKSLGDFTADLKSLTPGATALVQGPFGKFSHRHWANKNQIWLAGGVGITPFLSFARSLSPDDGYKINLYYCVYLPEEAVLLDELIRLSQANPNFRVTAWYSRDRGRIKAEAVSELSGGFIADGAPGGAKEILLCGPSAFMNDLKKQFQQAGAPKKNIHFEEFKVV